MSSSVRLGLVGLGNIGLHHFAGVRRCRIAGCELAAVCALAVPQGLELDGIPHYTEIEAMLDAGGLDAVLVAAPSHLHAPLAAAVLARGLHLLMEKPLGLSLLEAQRMVEQRPEGVQFGVMLNQRFDPAFAKLRECIAAGELGPIQRTHWSITTWFRPDIYFAVSDWRATWRGEGGGVLVNQCIHNLDLLQWLTGMPERVHGFCRIGRHHDIEVEDEVTAYLEYASGASATFVSSTGEAPGVNHLEIVGDRATATWDGTRLVVHRNEVPTSAYSRRTRNMFGQPKVTSEDLTPDRRLDAHAAVLQNFVDAVRGEAELALPAEEGLGCIELANAMLLSTWDAGPVDLPLDAARYQQELDQRIASSRLREPARLGAEVEVDMDASFR